VVFLALSCGMVVRWYPLRRVGPALRGWILHPRVSPSSVKRKHLLHVYVNPENLATRWRALYKKSEIVSE
jgi:hypothetical protein